MVASFARAAAACITKPALATRHVCASSGLEPRRAVIRLLPVRWPVGFKVVLTGPTGGVHAQAPQLEPASLAPPTRCRTAAPKPRVHRCTAAGWASGANVMPPKHSPPSPLRAGPWRWLQPREVASVEVAWELAMGSLRGTLQANRPKLATARPGRWRGVQLRGSLLRRGLAQFLHLKLGAVCEPSKPAKAESLLQPSCCEFVALRASSLAGSRATRGPAEPGSSNATKPIISA